MQLTETTDKATLQMLAKLEQRLAKVYPEFSDLPADAQKAIFLQAVENSTLAEVYEIEMRDPACIARREQVENERRQELIHRAKLAGANVDDSFERAAKEAAKQLRQTLK